MNICAIIVCDIVFLDNIGYAVYELKQKNKLSGISVIVLSIVMLVIFNYSFFNFN